MDFEELSNLSERELWTLFESTEDVEQGEVGLVLASKLNDVHEYAEAIAVAEIVVKLGERLASNWFIAEGYFWIGISNYRLQRYDESYEAYIACVDYYFQDGLERKAAHTMANAIDGLLQMHKYEDSYRLSMEGLVIARQIEAPVQIGRLGWQYMRACKALGHRQEIIDIAPEVIDAWNEVDDPSEVLRVREMYANALQELDRIDESLAIWKEIQKVARVLEFYGYEINAMIEQVQIYLNQDERTKALRTAETALELSLGRKMLWFASKLHWILGDSGLKDQEESLYHLREGIALIRTTSSADSWLYADLLISKIVTNQYYSEHASEFYDDCDALIAWSNKSEDRFRKRLFAEVKLLEHFVYFGEYETAESVFEIIGTILEKHDNESISLWMQISIAHAELRILLNNKEFEQVIAKGLECLSNFSESKNSNLHVMMAYEAVGDAMNAVNDARAVEMWNNAPILYGHKGFEYLAKSVAKKLLDQVTVPGQLF